MTKEVICLDRVEESKSVEQLQNFKAELARCYRIIAGQHEVIKELTSKLNHIKSQ